MEQKSFYLPPECEEICVRAEMNIMSNTAADIETVGFEDREW